MKKYDFIVYKTTDLSNNKIYIGYDSFNDSSYYGSGVYFLNVVKKYVKEYVINILNGDYKEYKANRSFYKKYKSIISLFFKKEILMKYNSMEEMIDDEPNWIKKYNSTDKKIGYNILYNKSYGDTFTKNPNKEKIRQNMINSANKPETLKKQIEKYYDPLFKESHRQSIIDGLNQPGIREKHKESINRPDIKEKHRLATIESKHKPGAKEKQIQAAIESKNRPGVREKQSQIMNDPIFKEIHRKLIIDALNKPEVKERFKLKVFRIVLQYDLNDIFIKEYESIKMAAFENNIKHSGSITNACKGNQKTAGGFKWKYKENII